MFPYCPYVVLTILPGEAEDVVAQHHQHNCAPRLPDNEQPLAIQSQQNPQVSSGTNHTNDTVNALDDQELDSVRLSGQASKDVDPSHPPRVTSVSGIMPDNNSDPLQLQHYTPPVHDIIECAKQISHCDLTSVNSFPLRANFNHKAVE